MFDLFRKTETKAPVNPRFRAYGKARIDIARRAVTRDDWDQLWKKPTYPFPFSWGSSWKQCIEYKVADFPAEVGFFIDFLGFPVNAFDPDYAMFTSPGGDFFFSVVPAREGEDPTQDGAIRLQFMVEDIIETSRELEARGVRFDQLPARVADNSAFVIGSFRTPNGIGIELWGFDSRTSINTSAKTTSSGEDDLDPKSYTNQEDSATDLSFHREQMRFSPAGETPSVDKQNSSSMYTQPTLEEVQYLDEDEL